MITSTSCDVFMGTAGGLREGGKEKERTDFRQAEAKKLRKDPGDFGLSALLEALAMCGTAGVVLAPRRRPSRRVA